MDKFINLIKLLMSFYCEIQEVDFWREVMRKS